MNFNLDHPCRCMDASDVRRTVRVIEWTIIGRVFYGQKGRGGKHYLNSYIL
jgi:hypothetical protein